MRADPNVARNGHRNAGVCPLFIDTKKWGRADSQHALLPERWGNMVSTIREQEA